MNTHAFTEPRPMWDSPLADRPDWDEIERVARMIRQTPRTEDARLFLNIGDERK